MKRKRKRKKPYTHKPVLESHEQQKQPLTRQNLTHRWFEAFTAIMLGMVAVATAWSGYQATRWAGEQSTLYAQATLCGLSQLVTRPWQGN